MIRPEMLTVRPSRRPYFLQEWASISLGVRSWVDVAVRMWSACVQLGIVFYLHSWTTNFKSRPTWTTSAPRSRGVHICWEGEECWPEYFYIAYLRWSIKLAHTREAVRKDATIYSKNISVESCVLDWDASPSYRHYCCWRVITASSYYTEKAVVLRFRVSIIWRGFVCIVAAELKLLLLHAAVELCCGLCAVRCGTLWK